MSEPVAYSCPTSAGVGLDQPTNVPTGANWTSRGNGKMHTQQKESPIKKISQTLDNPTEQEAIAWQSLSYSEKRVLCRGAHVCSLYWNNDWGHLFSADRMEIRSTIKKMTRVAQAFGGLHA